MVCWEMQFYGKVQGVWYRRFVFDRALELGITGWVKNEADGSVCAIAEHSTQEALESLMQACSEGPELAKVARIEIRHLEPQGFTDFQIIK